MLLILKGESDNILERSLSNWSYVRENDDLLVCCTKSSYNNAYGMRVFNEEVYWPYVGNRKSVIVLDDATHHNAALEDLEWDRTLSIPGNFTWLL